jgi:hypothetical protein
MAVREFGLEMKYYIIDKRPLLERLKSSFVKVLIRVSEFHFNFRENGFPEGFTAS